MQTNELADREPSDAAEIRGALKSVLDGPTFARSKRGRELLAYLVETTLDGRQSEIKAFSIACDVFGRDHTFDAENDALVRVQAGRVRTLLEDYYANEGKNDRWRITLPKGAYVPVFEIAEARPAADAAPDVLARDVLAPPALTPPPEDAAPHVAEAPIADERPATPPDRRWLFAALALLALTLAVGFALRRAEEAKPVQAQFGPTDGSISVLAASFVRYSPEVSDKAVEIIRSQLLQLTRLSFVTIYAEKVARLDGEDVDPLEIARRRGVHYLLEGRILGDDGVLRVNIDLLDVKSGKYIWTQSYDQKTPAGTKTVDELALSVMSSLHMVLLRAASKNVQGINLDSATPWDLLFLAGWLSGHGRNGLAWEKERIGLARRAIAKDPNFGPAYALLASKMAFLANIDPASDTHQAQTEARSFARRSLEAAPGDPDVTFNVALYHWYVGHINDAVMFMRRTLDLAPHHPMARFLVDVMPYTCAPAPPEAVNRLIAYDASLPPNSMERWTTLSWVALLYLNNGDYPHAVDYSKRSFAIFHSPDSMYRFAAAMAHVGDAQQARELLDEQKEYWPSIDPRHYADVVIPRRCSGAPLADFLHRAYLDLAPPTAGGAH